MNWIENEYGSINLGDKRLNARAKLLLKQLSHKPMESIPASCKGWGETKAAYRFFDHKAVSAKRIIKPHRIETLNRIKQHPIVLLIQDTTTLNYSGQTQRDDIGPLQQDNVRGLFLHPTFAITPNRECLGIIDYEQWAREKLAHQTRKERSIWNRQRPIKDKESYRWVRGYKKSKKLAEKLPDTQFVYIADREGDIYDLYEEAEKEFNQSSADWIIRATHDRAIFDENSATKRNKMKKMTKESPSIGVVKFTVGSSKKRKKREVTQHIFTKEVMLYPPREKAKKGGVPIKITVVIATEQNPPVGEEAIEWVLLTSMPVGNLEAALQIIEWYLCRWQIEIFFKILKSGCKIEKLQLNNKQRFDPCLALYLIITWRILFLTMLGRASPNLNSECVFDPIEWQTVYIMLHKKKPPIRPPNLNAMLKMIAQLGGFLGRKSDGDPGPGVMWKGLTNMYEHIKARQILQDVFGETYG
jgi:IS4 transposase